MFKFRLIFSYPNIIQVILKLSLHDQLKKLSVRANNEIANTLLPSYIKSYGIYRTLKHVSMTRESQSHTIHFMETCDLLLKNYQWYN